MQNSTLPLLQFRSKELSNQIARQHADDSFDGDSRFRAFRGIFNGLLFSSILWGVLAFTVYTVYNMVAGTH